MTTLKTIDQFSKIVVHSDLLQWLSYWIDCYKFILYPSFYYIFRIDRFKGTKENVFKIEKRLKDSTVLQPVDGEVNVDEMNNCSTSLSESDFSEPNT